MSNSYFSYFARGESWKRDKSRASWNKFFLNYDWVVVFSVLALIAIGLISLYSTSHPELGNFYKQLLWVGVSAVVFFMLGSIDYRLFKIHSISVLVLYALGILGLGSLYFLGTTIRGSRSWIDLGFFAIEPSEIVKIVLVLILAKYFSMRHVEMYRIQHLIVSGIYVLIPSLLVLGQPDMGSFLIFMSIWVGIMVVAGIKIKHLAFLAFSGVVLSIIAWTFFLYDYQKARILSFLDPSSDPLGAGYNSIQSVIAVASGGFWGKGLGRGTQSQLGFLPEVQTDFIFSAIVEEMGFFMAFVIFSLFVLLFWRMMISVSLATNNFARLTIVGFSILIISQLFLNVAMSLGLLPIAGVTLPFLSYGGSSLITLAAALGIVQSIHRHSSRYYQPKELFD